MHTHPRSTNGFTLIELLVVVAIIAILSSVLFYMAGPSVSRGNDAQRVQDIEQLQVALQLYQRRHGQFPNSTNCGSSVPDSDWCNSVDTMTSNGHWIKHYDGSATQDDVLAPFISNEPTDPQEGAGLQANNGTPGWMTSDENRRQPLGAYYYKSDGRYYMLAFRLSAPGSTHPLESRSVTDCSGDTWQFSTHDGTDFIGTSGTRIPGQITMGVSCQ